jgi:hypothetical protein
MSGGHYLPPSAGGNYVGHAFLPPSGAPQWVHCAMWPTMTQRFPELGGDEADEGVAAHWVALEAWVGRTYPEGARAPNGVTVTGEMLDGADLWLRAIGGAQPHDRVEQTVGRAPGAMNWGTPDLWRLTPGLLTVVDYKFGHEFVDAFENQQLVNYAELILAELGVPLTDTTLRVRLGIVQPRSYHRDGPVRWWDVGTVAALRPYVERQHTAQQRALAPEPVAVAGTHCKHCPGRHACLTLQRTALSAIDYAGHSPPVELPPDALGHELRAIERAAALLEARRTGLQEQALSLIKGGQRVPFYGVEPGQSRERWKYPADVLAPMAASMGIDLRKPVLLTPNQARDAGLDPSIVAALSDRPPGAVKLVADDGSKARRAFGANTA